MSELIDRGAEAMRTKRRELIAQPLERIWPDLMRAALTAIREPTEVMLTTVAPYPEHLVIERADAQYERAMRIATQIDQLAVKSRWQDMIDAELEAPALLPQQGQTND